MRKQESQNEKVDQLAKRLMDQTMLTDSEIDKIVASPMLYSSIRNRVNATPAAEPGFAWFSVPAFAVVAFMVVGGFTAFVVFSGTGEIAARISPKPAVSNSPITRSSEPDRIGNGFAKSDPDSADQPQRDSKMQIQNASYRKPALTVSRPSRPKVQKQPDLEFIPLVYTEDPAESVKGGRVIRVEMTRASLFAMGINVPLENGAETVKADLLVGQDGVPRGIRMPQ